MTRGNLLQERLVPGTLRHDKRTAGVKAHRLEAITY
jgi:hypothetical protein